MKTVVVLGDLNVDIIFSGMKQLPSLGKEVLAGGCTRKVGGSAANVAIVLAVNGCPVKLFSRVGDGPEGEYLLKSVKDFGIDTDTITCAGGESTGITVSLTYPHDRMYVTHPGTIASTRLEDLPNGFLSKADHLHLASYYLQEALQPSVGPLLEQAKQAGMSTSLDPGGDPAGRWDLDALRPHLRHIDWFMPNADEIKAIMRTRDVEEAIRDFPREAAGLVVKVGAHGAVTRHGGIVEHHQAEEVDAVDTTCAGDCFDAGFLFALSSGESPSQAARLGNRFGAEAVSCVGLPLYKIGQ